MRTKLFGKKDGKKKNGEKQDKAKSCGSEGKKNDASKSTPCCS